MTSVQNYSISMENTDSLVSYTAKFRQQAERSTKSYFKIKKKKENV